MNSMEIKDFFGRVAKVGDKIVRLPKYSNSKSMGIAYIAEFRENFGGVDIATLDSKELLNIFIESGKSAYEKKYSKTDITRSDFIIIESEGVKYITDMYN